MVAARPTLKLLFALALLIFPAASKADAKVGRNTKPVEEKEVRLDNLALTLMINSDTPVADVLDMLLPEEDYTAVDEFEMKEGVDIETVPMYYAPVVNGKVQFQGNKLELKNRTVNIGGTIYKYDSMKTPFQNWQVLHDAIVKLPNHNHAHARTEVPSWLSIALHSLLGNDVLADVDCQYYVCDTDQLGVLSSIGTWLGNIPGHIENGLLEAAATVSTVAAGIWHAGREEVREAVTFSGMQELVCAKDRNGVDGYGIRVTNENNVDRTVSVTAEQLRSMVHGNESVPDTCPRTTTEEGMLPSVKLGQLFHNIRGEDLDKFLANHPEATAHTGGRTPASKTSRRVPVCRKPNTSSSSGKKCRKPGSTKGAGSSAKRNNGVVN